MTQVRTCGTLVAMQSARIAVARLRRRDPAALDRAVAIVLLVAVGLQVSLDDSVHHPVLTGIAGSVAALAVATRRRWPLGSLVVSLGVTLAAEAVGGPGTSAATATIVSTVLLAYGAGAFLAMPRAAVALGIGAVGLAVNVAITTRASDDLFFDVVVVGLMPWAVGRMLRTRAAREHAHRELAERLDAERELLARESALAERARIARELHDVIAHSVSVMVIQSGGARMVMDTEPDRAEASLLQVERAGREALAELRRLVGSLHPADAASLAPPPRLADIDDLIARARAAGLETDLRVQGDAVGLPAALDLCAYRIVQESLTNAIKHAGRARVSVRLCWLGDALELEVADDGRGSERGDGQTGHGIDGMTERVAMHGGILRAGHGPDGGFAVHARLPLTGGAA